MKKLKTLLATLLMIALVLPVCCNFNTADAAAKLSKKDFKFGGNAGENFYAVSAQYGWRWNGWGDLGESQPKKLVKTKRGIRLLDSKKKVFKAYGKVTLKKSKKDNVYKEVVKQADAGVKKQLNTCKYAEYSMKKGGDTYAIRFFFDNKDKVRIIIVLKNPSRVGKK